MNVLYSIVAGTALSLVFLALVFIPMEKVFPAQKDQKIFRAHWFTDLLFFIGQYFLWGFLVLWALSHFNFWLKGIVPQDFRLSIQSQSFWLQVIEVIVLSDFIIYWGHRLQHKVGFLWRFHKVHHSAEHLDWLAAHREHPLDSIYTIGLINLPAFILGFPLETLVGFIAFRGIWAIYIHSNVRLPLRFLRKVIGSPELHHWHHDLNRDAGNYANISPLMDLLFGTYTCPDHEPEKFGIREPFPKNYFGQLIHPLLPGFLSGLHHSFSLASFRVKINDSLKDKSKMERSFIAPLEKTRITRVETQNNTTEPGCCGGAPSSNADACCKLDEDKKAEGESGCGCGTTTPAAKKSSCC